MQYLIIFTVIIVIFILLMFTFKNVKKKTKKKKKTFLSNLTIPSFNVNFSKYVKNKTYFKYIDKINNEINYLTWRYSGVNPQNGQNNYILTLVPYKNKQNEFIIHYDDALYLMPFYLKNNLYTPELEPMLNKLLFITSEYNVNKDQYLELEIIKNADNNMFIIRASIGLGKGPYSYLHIDDKYKLYFENDISDNIAKFLQS